MIADVVHGFASHLRSGHVYELDIELPMSDGGEESFYSVRTYVIASSPEQAHYIAATLYPDSLSICHEEQPITERRYVSSWSTSQD